MENEKVFLGKWKYENDKTGKIIEFIGENDAIELKVTDTDKNVFKPENLDLLTTQKDGIKNYFLPTAG